jgi:protein SCO1
VRPFFDETSKVSAEGYDMQRMRVRTGFSARRRAAALLAVVTLGGVNALAGCAAQPAAAAGAAGPVAKVEYTSTSAFAGDVLTTPFALPTQTFTDTGGAQSALQLPAKGDVTLVFYGFTHCTDDCPTTMADIEAALRGMPQAEQDRIGMDFVTTDPWRDTPAVLRAWLSQYNPKFTGYTAAWSTIHTSGASLGIDVEMPTTRAGDYQVTHGLQVLAFTSDGKAHIEWLVEELTVTQLRHDFQLILDGTPIR